MWTHPGQKAWKAGTEPKNPSKTTSDDGTPRATMEHHEQQRNTTSDDGTPQATTEHHERQQ
ncbi:hypothetical protein PGTUg99_020649 [Puccinia graminis f. sp. tritici]|uniref:Uncharacterized protein n=1 Tax=Puccinia graminis f. sp. tritici TaxID=56615 RepID=A0A5B0RXK6_PUCGR|nr:hypothetical protein PGTUg99_020649 [Puccinia graminis f. sp. tritici]